MLHILTFEEPISASLTSLKNLHHVSVRLAMTGVEKAKVGCQYLPRNSSTTCSA